MFAIVGCLMVSACIGGPSHTVTHELLINQAALVPAPRGAPAAGPLVEAGHVAIEGGYSSNPQGEDAPGSEPGNVVLRQSATARIAGSFNENVELGFGFDYAHAEWGTARLAPIEIGTSQAGAFFRAGATIRGIVAGDGSLGLGMIADLSVGSIPYRRTAEYEVRYQENGLGSATPSQQLHHSLREVVERKGYVFGSLGLFGSFRIASFLHVSPGFVVQNYPIATGTEHQYVICPSWGPSDTYCDELDDFGSFDGFSSVLVVTPYLSASVELGPLALVSQIYTSVGDYRVSTAAPFGVDASVRFTF